MCGRYASSRDDADIVGAFDIDEVEASVVPSWNVAPTQPARIVVESDRTRRLCTARWGLIPSWASDARSAVKTINARVETVAERPAYRDALAHRRALVPATGYYEWQRTAVGTVPHFLSLPGDQLALAALWEVWLGPDGKPVRTFSIVTRPAPEPLCLIHDRAPVIVPRSMRSAWLAPALRDRSEAQALLAAVPYSPLQAVAVGPQVGSVAANGPELVLPVQAALTLFD